MEQIIINEVWDDPNHNRNLDQDNYNISRTRDDTINNMHHIHNSCEFLLVEEGAAFYYIDGQPYYAEAGDILAIGAMSHHQRIIHKLPFQRYGFTVRPTYYKSLLLENDLQRVFETPSVERYNKHYKHIDPAIFSSVTNLLQTLKGEEKEYRPFRSHMERTIVTQITVILFRAFRLKQDDTPLAAAHAHMLEIKEHIDLHHEERLDLKALSERFFLHPATISKDFHKYCGHSLNKYINLVRVSEAARLLEKTNDSVARIAEKCGYDSDNTFLRQFKSIMQISPSQYRKTFREVCRHLTPPGPSK